MLFLDKEDPKCDITKSEQEDIANYIKEAKCLMNHFTENKTLSIYAKDAVPLKPMNIICIVESDLKTSKINNFYIGEYTDDIKQYLDSYTSIGSISLNEDREVIGVERGQSWQGSIYKNQWAFYSHSDDIAYIPELHETAYNYKDFISLCGFEDYAEIVFDAVD